MLQEKIKRLESYFQALPRVAVAFSGGVDSALLLKIAAGVLHDNVTALTADIPSFPPGELDFTRNFCRQYGIRQIVLPIDQLAIPGFRENKPRRCYLCKQYLISELQNLARAENMGPLCEGSNLDDFGDYRPGLQAVKELQIASPLQFAGFTKADVRQAAQELGLTLWNKPATPCLVTRIAYDEEITAPKLEQIARAEAFLTGLGFNPCRVRLHNMLARIEIPPAQFDKFMSQSEQIATELRRLGFKYITLDLQGLRSGSMNEILKNE